MVRQTDNVSQHAASALSDLDSIESEAMAIAEAAAAEELATKTYQDRTTNLRKATTAKKLSNSRDGWLVELAMGSASVLYGIFVQARGFSNFTQIGIIAGMDIDAMIRRITSRAGRRR